MTISALLDRGFPAIASKNNQPMPYVTTKTVAYIFALIINCVTVFHQVSPHSRALQHEASILKELNSMPPDDFSDKAQWFSHQFLREVLKKAGAGGHPVAMPLSRRFVTKGCILTSARPRCRR
jgi:hypothetical protein